MGLFLFCNTIVTDVTMVLPVWEMIVAIVAAIQDLIVSRFGCMVLLRSGPYEASVGYISDPLTPFYLINNVPG